MRLVTPFGLALAELAFVSLAGAAVAVLRRSRATRPSTALLTGLLVMAAEVPFLTLMPRPAAVAAVVASIAFFAGILVYRRGIGLRGLVSLPGGVLVPAAIAAVTILLAGSLLANDYRAGSLLDADSLVFWSLRGHFIFAEGLFSPGFWGVVHPDYPPLLPLLNAHGYFLAGTSGEISTVATSYVLAFVALFALGEALVRVVSRPWAFAVPLLFVLAPVPVFPVHPRVLLGGYADAWSILFVALVCRWDPAARRQALSWDEGVALVVISLLKNEGYLMACVYAVARVVLIGLGDPRPWAAVVRAVPRFALALAPGFAWTLLVQAARVSTHYGFFRLPSPSDTAQRAMALIEFYRGLPWVYWLVPVVLACALGVAVSTGPPGPGRRDPWTLWMVFHAAALYALIVAVVATFNGLPRLALENSFHRLHWSVLLVCLVLAARLAGPTITPATPAYRTPGDEAAPA